MGNVIAVLIAIPVFILAGFYFTWLVKALTSGGHAGGDNYRD